MIWQLFRWTWRLDGPLFVGTSPAGVLNRCRPYIPARTIWGAVTAELARVEADDDKRYVQVGDELRKQARFSYLYPAEFVDRDWFAWLPEYREREGLVWVREGGGSVHADRRFRRRLLWTRPATAIDPDNDAALDGSLRETECVQPHWRREGDSPGGPVGMVGYVFIRESKNIAERLRALRTLFVGGDTRYGLGCIVRVAMEPAKALFGATVDLDREQPCVITDRTLAHALASNGAPMCGAQEAIGGWDMTKPRVGRRIHGPVWTPGSRIPAGDRSPHFQIDEHGIWRLEERHASKPLSNRASSS
ncbi:MAG: hypothetical protein KatS3mg011_1030 [Acidimicrobiia bacterium]|nr:MAG: hypothetical protein KatS3mg011_1030 [Acidimicrobiia bacterium]